MEACGSRCWPDPGHPSGAEGQGSLAGTQWRIWDAPRLGADLRQHGRGETQALLICSSRLQPLLAPPTGSHFPKDVEPPWVGVTLLRAASEGSPTGRGAVGGTFSPRQTGALAC